MAELKFIVSMDSSQFKAGAQEVKAQVHQITDEVKKEGGKMQGEFEKVGKTLGSSMGKYLAAFGGAAVFKSLIDNIVRVRGEFQKAGVAIETMLGSKERADELMAEVKQIAASSPLEFGDITRATQQMLSFNIEAEKVPGFLRAIGDVSMGEKDRFNALSLAFSQMSATGKLMGQDLLQMINAGFNPLAEISRTTGKSMAQLKDEMSKGAISAEMVQKAFIDATSAGGKFFGMSENAAKTIQGQFSMLQDAMNAAFNELGTSTEGMITGAIQATTTLVKNYETIIKVVAALAANYGVYRAAVVVVTAAEEAHGIVQAAAAAKTTVLKKAQDALNKSMLANPYVAATVALTALVTAIVAASNATDEFENAADRLNDTNAEIEKSVAAEMRNFDILYRKMVEAGKGTKEYETIKQQIIDQYGQYYAGLANEIDLVGKSTSAYDQLTLAIRKSIAARQLQSFINKQADAADKVVQNSLDKAWETLRKKFSQDEAAKLYKSFFDYVTKGTKIATEDAKKLRDIYVTDVGMTGGFFSFRKNLTLYAQQARDANKAFEQSIDAYKKMYDVVEETTKTPTTPPTTPLTSPTTVKASKKAQADRERLAKQEADEYDRLAEIHYKQLTEEGRKATDLQLETNEKEIAAMKEGVTKTLAEIEHSKQKETVALTRWYEDLRLKRIEEAKKLWDAQKSNEGKKFYESEAFKQAASMDAYTDEEKDAYRRRSQAIIDSYNNQLDEITKTERAALRDFLKEYGDYQQQRLAIAQEYAEKIAEAGSVGESMALKAQEQDAYKALDFDRFKKALNWDELFGDLDSVSAEHLNLLRDQLERTLKDTTLRASDYKAVVEQIDNIEKAIVERQNEWKNAIGLTIPELERRKVLEQEAERAQQRVLDLQKQQEEAQKRINSAKTAIIATGIKIDASEITVDNAQEIVGKFDPNTAIYKTLTQLFGNLATAERELKDTTDELSSAENKAVAAVDKTKTSFADALNLISQVTDKINSNVQSAAELIETIGLSDTSFGKGFGEFAESAQAATGAIKDLMSGNYMGALNGALKSIGSLGNALGSLGLSGFGESDKRLAEDIEKLTASNESLKRSIEDLTNEMSNAAVADAADIYKQLVDNLEKSEANTQEMLRRMGAAYNNGFLGIGGSGSSNAKINAGVTAAEWERISKIVGRSVTSADQFWSLTSEQMANVAKTAPEIYGRIKQLAGAGFQDAGQYMEEYIQYWKDLETAQQSYFEKMTDASLDNIVSDFKSALLDMDTSASDFADKFEDYMRNAIINALVTDQFEPMIKEWYEAFAKAMETEGIDEAEAAALKQRWNAITEAGMQMRDQLRDQFGWGSTGDGSGAYQAVASFTQEQGDELNGRLTAIQIGQERNNQSLVMAVTTLQELSVVVNANAMTLNEMRNLMLVGNGHLEDIARYTKLTSQHSALLEEISTKIKTL